MAIGPEVKVHIAADTAALRAELAKMSAEIRKHASVAEKSLGGLDGMFGQVRTSIAGLAAGIGVGGMVALGRQALDAAGGIGELSDQLGVGTQALQELEYGAVTAGVKTDELHGALSKLTAKIGSAADGSDEAIASFDALGVKILDAGGKTRVTEAVLRDIAQAYAEMGDKTKAAALIKDIFGKSAQKLIPLLKDGADGLEDMADAARDVGAVLSDEAIAAADEAADKIAALEKAAGKAAQTFMAQLAPSITAFLDAANRTEGLDELQARLESVRKAKADLVRESPVTSLLRSDLYSLRDGDPTKGRREELDRQIGEIEARIAYVQALANKRVTGVAFGTDQGGNVDLATLRPSARPDIGVSNPTGKGAAGKAADEAEKQAEALAKATRALDNQAEAFGRTAAQIAVYDAFSRANVDTSGLLVTASGTVIGTLTAQEQALAVAAVRVVELTEAEEARRQAQARLNQSEAETWDAMLKQSETRTKLVSDMSDEVAVNDRLLAALAESEQAYERVKAQIEAVNKAKQAGIELSPEELAQVESYSEKLGDQRAEMERLKDQHEDLRRAGSDVFHTLAGGFEDAVLKGEKLSDVFKALEQDLARIIMRMAMTKPLENAIGGMNIGGGLASLFGGMFSANAVQPGSFSGVDAATSQSIVNYGFASGTPNAPAGWAWTGEEGPELMRLPGGTQIFPADISARLASGEWPTIQAPPLPNMGVASAGVSPSVINHFSYQIDARGADEAAVRRIEQAVTSLHQSFDQRAVGAVRMAVRRGGTAAADIRGR